MTTSAAKKTIAVNLAFWVVAMLIHPVLRLIPTGSGQPPKIFDVLIPLLFILLAYGSTYLLKTAMNHKG